MYRHAKTSGLVHASCEQYTAENLSDRACTDLDVCRDCSWPPPAEGDSGLENCTAVPAKKYYLSEYWMLHGADKMKAEIAANGPISCGMHVTDAFETYAGGIYSEKVLLPTCNHEISLVGYGYDEESDREYWIGRNSWGTNWGEEGFFRI